MGYQGNYPITIQKVITSALRKLGIIRQGGSPTQAQFDECQEALAIILEELGGLYKHQWLLNAVDISLISGTAMYNITNTIPLMDKIYSASYVDAANIVTPCEIVDAVKILSFSTSSTLPTTHVNFFRGFNGSDWSRLLTVYPTPTGVTTQKIRLVCRIEMQIPTISTDILTVPYNFYRYIVFRLASDIAHEHGININEIALLEQKADKAFVGLIPDSKTTSLILRDHRYDLRTKQGFPVDVNEEN